MKRLKQFLALLLLLVASSTLTGQAAESADDKSAPPPKTDPATELRHQDWAFSLLIEAYRQIQNSLIQSDYEKHLQAAARLTDSDAREHVLTLAKQERELRIRKLCVQLGNFGLAYDQARQGDQERENITVPHEVNTDAAADVLKDFVAITPADQSPTGQSQTCPAGAVLLDKRPNL